MPKHTYKEIEENKYIYTIKKTKKKKEKKGKLSTERLIGERIQIVKLSWKPNKCYIDEEGEKLEKETLESIEKTFKLAEEMERIFVPL